VKRTLSLVAFPYVISTGIKLQGRMPPSCEIQAGFEAAGRKENEKNAL